MANLAKNCGFFAKYSEMGQILLPGSYLASTRSLRGVSPHRWRTAWVRAL
jgi:hypothetical protein